MYKNNKDYCVLKTIFGEDIEIVDPSNFRVRDGYMNFYLNLINGIDSVVYVPFLDFTTADVFDEAIYALRQKRMSTDYLVIRYIIQRIIWMKKQYQIYHMCYNFKAGK